MKVDRRQYSRLENDRDVTMRQHVQACLSIINKTTGIILRQTWNVSLYTFCSKIKIALDVKRNSAAI